MKLVDRPVARHSYNFRLVSAVGATVGQMWSDFMSNNVIKLKNMHFANLLIVFTITTMYPV